RPKRMSFARSDRTFLGRNQRRQIESPNFPIEVFGNVIETTSTQWHYCLTFDINLEIMGKVPTKSLLIAEAIIEVDRGAVGIAWIDRENQLVSIEQVVLAKAGTQHVVVSVGSEKAHRLMLRNAAPNGRKALFILKDLSVKANSKLAG